MKPKPVTDYDILKKYNQLIPENDGSWESSLVEKYHESLFKEFAICDLSRYKTGQIGIRWRTEAEVIRGKGEKTCASKTCDETYSLASYQNKISQKWYEGKITKICTIFLHRPCKCAEKLNYKTKHKLIQDS